MVNAHVTKRGRNRSEKRKSARIIIENVTVELYSTDGRLGEPETCDVINLSEGGMLLTCDKKYGISNTLRVTFVVPDSMITVRSDAVVVHGFVDLSGKYIGVRFANLPIPEHAMIKQFINRNLNN